MTDAAAVPSTAAVAAQAAPTAAAKTRSLVARMADRFNVDADKLMTTLKATAFRQRPDKQGRVYEPSNEEMMALLVIADQYRLNPFTRELFAFLDPKSGAIVPVVSVDGWIRIINEQPTLRSLSFAVSQETTTHKAKTCHLWMECRIVRSDRDEPIVIREYFDEVVRRVDFATPWDSHPNRMHHHKTLIQAARVAFGFGGIYDEDEAHRVIEGEGARVPETSPALAEINRKVAPAPSAAAPALEHQPAQGAPLTLPGTAERVAVEPPASSVAVDAAASKTAPTFTFADVSAKIAAANDADSLADAVSVIDAVADPAHRKRLHEIAEARERELDAED